MKLNLQQTRALLALYQHCKKAIGDPEQLLVRFTQGQQQAPLTDHDDVVNLLLDPETLTMVSDVIQAFHPDMEVNTLPLDEVIDKLDQIFTRLLKTEKIETSTVRYLLMEVFPRLTTFFHSWTQRLVEGGQAAEKMGPDKLADAIIKANF